ncbi:MAG: glycine betaine/L-proline ABC transporter ATP-binding protein [Actinobacteria bacterium]|nr:glycine betaine/L-proline ABC transporter ATP-binding protein [Actinomycetota bacterium]
MNKLEIKNLYKIFGKDGLRAYELIRNGVSLDEVRGCLDAFPAVVDASFDVKEGEIFVVMGLSGSGKSSLVRCMNRLYEPTAGSISIDGVDLTRLSQKELRRLRLEKISMVFQHFALFPHYSVLENTGWGLEVKGVDKAAIKTKALEALEMVGLSGWEDKYPHQLSGGMQQRVGLARALATDTNILLMDEAFSALDPLIRNEMQQQLVMLQGDLQKTVVFITHDLNEAMYLGDRIAIMKDGHIEQIGTAEDILRNPATEYVAAFIEQVDRSRVLTAGSIMSEPVAVLPIWEGPSAALRTMRERQVSALHLVGPKQYLLGVVYADEVISAVRTGESELEPLVHPEVPAVGQSTPIADLLVSSAEYMLPLPVVEEGKLVGVVPRVALLMALGERVNASNGNGDGDVSAGVSNPARERELQTVGVSSASSAK